VHDFDRTAFELVAARPYSASMVQVSRHQISDSLSVTVDQGVEQESVLLCRAHELRRPLQPDQSIEPCRVAQTVDEIHQSAVAAETQQANVVQPILLQEFGQIPTTSGRLDLLDLSARDGDVAIG
jgi:hypothetical protein